MTTIFQYIIKIYVFAISPFLGQNCRFYPTCSSYAYQALEKHGIIKGLALTTARILSCHPWSKRNFIDPVPLLFTWKDILSYKHINHKNKNRNININTTNNTDKA